MEQHEEYADDRYDNGAEPSYWSSVGIAAIGFGIIYFILSIIGGYMTINSEPTGSWFSSQTMMGLVACLVTAFGGMVAVWHYNREFGVTMKLGRGALIGLFTGIAMALVMSLLSQIWTMIDPTFNEQLMEATIANYEAMDMPQETKQGMIDGIYQQFQDADTLWGMVRGFLFLSIPTGILNMLTGMLGVAMFARQKDEI